MVVFLVVVMVVSECFSHNNDLVALFFIIDIMSTISNSPLGGSQGIVVVARIMFVEGPFLCMLCGHIVIPYYNCMSPQNKLSLHRKNRFVMLTEK